MQKALHSTAQYFESSCSRTPQYLSWHRLFKREFSQLLKRLGAVDIEVMKPNHFDMSGFFRVSGQLWYFSVSDLRFFKDTLLVRTAEHNKDWTGGGNQYVPLKISAEDFEQKLAQLVAP